MKKRTSYKEIRRQRKKANAWGYWVSSGPITLGNIDASASLYFDTSAATTVTFPEGTFNGFQTGDIITINDSYTEVKKKKKVHVARRYRKEKPVTHTITNVSETTMTIAVNDLVTATKISEDSWSVHSSTGTITF
jgi:hypothetical protein